MKPAISVLVLLLAIVASGASIQQQPANTQSSTGVQITQPPRVESTTPSSATIAWSTNVQAGTKVLYGTDPNRLTWTASAPWGGYTHRVYLKNLQPDTTYYFQAISGDAYGTGTSVSSNVGHFTTSTRQTSPPPPQ